MRCFQSPMAVDIHSGSPALHMPPGTQHFSLLFSSFPSTHPPQAPLGIHPRQPSNTSSMQSSQEPRPPETNHGGRDSNGRSLCQIDVKEETKARRQKHDGKHPSIDKPHLPTI